MTTRAWAALLRIQHALPPSEWSDGHILVICWMAQAMPPVAAPGPTVGVHRDSEVPEAYKVHAQGNSVGYAMSDEMLQRLQGKVLDYTDGAFRFVDPVADC